MPDLVPGVIVLLMLIALAAALGGAPGTPIDESTEYDRLYVIDLSFDGPVSRIERFGVRYQPTE